MAAGDIVVVAGTTAPQMTIGRIDGFQAALIWFWNGRIREMMADLRDLSLVH